MSRVARIVIPGYPFHITHRGNNKQIIFLTDDDRRTYLYLLEKAKQKFGMRILSYCLMNNHVHFIAIADNEQSFAKTIGSVHTHYANYFNRKNEMVGHLWQGRYYSCLLDNVHLLAAVRYVERNPVRGDMVLKPCEWIWSSAREHLCLKEKGILSLENISSYLDVSLWRQFLDMDDRQEDLIQIRKETNSLRVWAEDSFKEAVENKYGFKFSSNTKGRPVKMK